MPLLKVVDRDGKEHEVKAPASGVLMEPLRDMDDGVTAICGGMCSCATCHIYIDEAWESKLPPKQGDEVELLREMTHTNEHSRLSCQVQFTAALAGLKVAIAPDE